MRIIIAPDSFKGSLSALQVAQAMERGVRRVFPDAHCTLVPLADGGEGTARSMLDALGGRWVQRRVCGPHGRPVTARYGLLNEGWQAIIEMAQAAGLQWVEGKERNPRHTTTYGVGELIGSALDHGVQEIIIGIGGSATCDGGAGMAQALGARFYDRRGACMAAGLSGGQLRRVHRIDVSELDRRLRKCRLRAACDVDNVLVGRYGTARVFGPQKGLTEVGVARLDANLRHLAGLYRRDLKRDVARKPRGGAGGGLGAGLLAFTGARLQSGVDIVLKALELEKYMRRADLVITGEGRIDYQTAFGKTPAGVARLARKCRVPVVAIGGTLADDTAGMFGNKIDALESAVARDMTLEEALRHPKRYLKNAAERALRLIKVGQRLSRPRRGGPARASG